MLTFEYDDGGRALAGYKGKAGDCVTRSIAIAADLPYQEVYDALHSEALERRNLARLELRYGANARRHASPRDGVPRKVYDPYLAGLGWEWVPTMGIGTGCKVHLTDDELPMYDRMILRLSRHLTAIVGDTIRDTHDPSRDGTRCVYGYWRPPSVG